MKDVPFAPRPTGKPEEDTCIDGCLLPWCRADDQPALVSMVGSDAFYLPVFSTIEKLRTVMKRVGVPYDHVKQIVDGFEFWSSVASEVVVIKDPWYQLDGTLRFTQVRFVEEIVALVRKPTA